MKIILVITLLLSAAFIAGCGGEDGPVIPPPPTVQTVTATLGSAAPDRFNVNDAVWNSVSPATVPVKGIAFATSGKIAPPSALAVAANVLVKALVFQDTLYFQLVWDDDTEDKWPARFSVTSLQELTGDTLAIFLQDVLNFNEDQAMLFFAPAGETIWDVWNWRAVTTGAGRLAEGFRWSGASLLRDGGVQAVGISNLGDAGYPAKMHAVSPNNLGHILLSYEAVPLQTNVDSVRWSVGDVVPGYTINDSLWTDSHAGVRGSRFDVFAGQSYATGTYTITLSRALNTGNTDDLDLSAHSTVKMKIGITNNSSFNMTQGDTKQGFTATFNLALP